MSTESNRKDPAATRSTGVEPDSAPGSRRGAGVILKYELCAGSSRGYKHKHVQRYGDCELSVSRRGPDGCYYCHVHAPAGSVRLRPLPPPPAEPEVEIAELLGKDDGAS